MIITKSHDFMKNECNKCKNSIKISFIVKHFVQTDMFPQCVLEYTTSFSNDMFQPEIMANDGILKEFIRNMYV